MTVLTLTEAVVADLLACAKHVENPGSRERVDGKHLRRDYRVVSDDGHHEFALFTRQSTIVRSGFSAGLRWRSKAGEEVILVRCNGADHAHSNMLERERFGPQCHVHTWTERYMVAGKRGEGLAKPTSAYRTLQGALHELTQIANITGLSTLADEADLFN